MAGAALAGSDASWAAVARYCSTFAKADYDGHVNIGDVDGVSLALQPVARPRAQVEEQLRERILSGAISVGERLPSETRLAETLQVSRTTVREALRTLAASGLITKVAGKGGGSFVNGVDHLSLGTTLRSSMSAILQLGRLDYADVDRVRRLLEPSSARLAALNRTDEDLQRIRAAVDRGKQIQVGEPEVPQVDLEFHVAIAEASGNQLLAAFVAGLNGFTHPTIALRLTPETGAEGGRQHSAIYRSIERGDADGAERAMVRHLDFLEKITKE